MPHENSHPEFVSRHYRVRNLHPPSNPHPHETDVSVQKAEFRNDDLPTLNPIPRREIELLCRVVEHLALDEGYALLDYVLNQCSRFPEISRPQNTVTSNECYHRRHRSKPRCHKRYVSERVISINSMIDIKSGYSLTHSLFLLAGIKPDRVSYEVFLLLASIVMISFQL